MIILIKLGLSQPLFWHKLYSKLGFGIAALVSSAGTACAQTTTDAKRASMRQRFPFKFLKEEDAYAAAIECVEAGFKSK